MATQTVSPTELEADLLTRSAQRLQRVHENWEGNYVDLAGALKFTNDLWGILLGAVIRDDNPLPLPIRQNVANLGIFVLSRIVEIQLEPAPDKLESIININRELAAGLRATGTE